VQRSKLEERLRTSGLTGSVEGEPHSVTDGDGMDHTFLYYVLLTTTLSLFTLETTKNNLTAVRANNTNVVISRAAVHRNAAIFNLVRAFYRILMISQTVQQ